MKPIKDCGWVEPDGTCGLPSNLTPECHIAACPRLAPVVSALLAACEAALEYLTDKAADQDLDPDGIEAELALLLVRLETETAKAKGE